MAGAYGTFARNGYYIKPYSYTKVIFRETDEVHEYKYEKTQAMSEETAYMITDMLVTATEQGVGGNINVSGTQVASKTGTSTHSKKGVPDSASKDNWVITYSPDYVISFWYGTDYLTKNEYTTALAAAKERKLISAQLANNIYKKNSTFKKPSGIIAAKYEKESFPAQSPSDYTPAELISSELFKKGTEPSEVSDRFSQLQNPKNGSVEVSNTQINLSWNEINTPNAINTTHLQGYFSEYYGQFASTYLNKRIEYNNTAIGTIGYQVYLQTSSGLQLLGFTASPYYVYNATTPGTYTFVIKSTYSIFKANASTGITLTADVTSGSISSLPENKEENTEGTENTPENVEVAQ
jgi:membrane carboxypeptidase/penicillin-binding protein PbpC